MQATNRRPGIRNEAAYLRERHPSAANDPIFHWAKLFDGIFPPGTPMRDIDHFVNFHGYHLFTEAKSMNGFDHALRYGLTDLESIAKQPTNSVLLVAIHKPDDDEYGPSHRPVRWVWIGNPKWRDPASSQWGSVAMFREMIEEWKKRTLVLVHDDQRRAVRASGWDGSGEQLNLFPSGT